MHELFESWRTQDNDNTCFPPTVLLHTKWTAVTLHDTNRSLQYYYVQTEVGARTVLVDVCAIITTSRRYLYYLVMNRFMYVMLHLMCQSDLCCKLTMRKVVNTQRPY